MCQDKDILAEAVEVNIILVAVEVLVVLEQVQLQEQMVGLANYQVY